MCEDVHWGHKEWAEYCAQNKQLQAEGWVFFKIHGPDTLKESEEWWAEKDGVKINRDPADKNLQGLLGGYAATIIREDGIYNLEIFDGEKWLDWRRIPLANEDGPLSVCMYNDGRIRVSSAHRRVRYARDKFQEGDK